jgi:PAS domain S-box-containing protein
MSGVALAFFGLAFLFRTSLALNFISSLYLLIGFVAAIILVFNSGNIYSSILPWLSFIPLSANLLINRKAAYLWLAACIITVFAFAYIQDSPSNIDVQYDKEWEIWFYAIVYNGLIAIIVVLSMIFQKAKDNVLTALKENNEFITSINHELKNKNNEILSQNEALSQQKEEILAQREFIDIKNKELLVVQDELNSLIDKLTITQNTLSNREAENRSILEALYHTELLVAELDIHGNFIKISPRALKFFNMAEEEIVGNTFKEIGGKINYSRNEILNQDELWQDVINGNNSSHEALIHINNYEFWLKENFFLIQDQKGEPTKVMIVAQDITEIKNQQNEIESLNTDLKENIWKIEKQNGLLHSQSKEIENINKELKNSNEEIRTINLNLENHVKERTQHLELQNKQLSEYAYINAHLLRGPLCSILGLVQLMENGNAHDVDSLIFHMNKSVNELQEVIDKISKAIEKGTHFDRSLIYKN